MIPVIENAIEQIRFVSYPSFTYLLSNWVEEEPRVFESKIAKEPERVEYAGYTIRGDVDGLNALKQAIFHRIFTERYAYAIYDDNYGTELEQYQGSSFAFLEATIENTLRDSLLQDDRIINLKVTRITKIDMNNALVEFDVLSNMGSISIADLSINLGGNTNE